MAEKRRDIFVDGMSLNRAPYFGLHDFLTQFSDLLKNPSKTFFKKKKNLCDSQHSSIPERVEDMLLNAQTGR